MGEISPSRASRGKDRVASTLPPKRGTKKVALKFRQAFTLGGNFLNYYYHSVRAPPRDKQSYSLCGIDNTSLLIHSWYIMCSNVFKIRCFALSFSCAGAACGGDNLRSFRQEYVLGEI